jgi:hypothetical protein
MGEERVSVDATKRYARRLGGSERRKSSSGRLKEEQRKRKGNRPGMAAHTKEGETGTVLLKCSSFEEAFSTSELN